MTQIADIEKTELVWLPAGLAKKVKEVQDVKLIEREIVAYVAECKGTMHAEIENLDEDILQFRAAMIKARNAFNDAKNEQLRAWETLWDEHEKEIGQVRQKVNFAVKEIAPLKQELSEVATLTRTIEQVNVKGLLETLESVNQASNGTKALLKFLLNNYK